MHTNEHTMQIVVNTLKHNANFHLWSQTREKQTKTSIYTTIQQTDDMATLLEQLRNLAPIVWIYYSGGDCGMPLASFSFSFHKYKDSTCVPTTCIPKTLRDLQPQTPSLCSPEHSNWHPITLRQKQLR